MASWGHAPRIFVIDDETNILNVVRLALEAEGYAVRFSTDPHQALEQINEWAPDVVVTDIRMAGIDGLGVLARLQKVFPEINVILMTAHASVSTAVEALRGGAFDYLIKPFKISDLRIVIKRALSQKRIASGKSLSQNCQLPEFAGQGPATQHLLEVVAKAAASDSTLLLTGESGTGKELIARRLHVLSARQSQAFISLNCAALPEGLLESELFGYEAGAFTDARVSKAGLFQAAHRGTLFLDEINSLSLGLQAKLLRVLQEREIRPIGSHKNMAIDVRLIAATNSDLQKVVQQGAFREDLFYRLNVIPISLPPLRERLEDIPDLVSLFMDKIRKKYDKLAAIKLTSGALSRLSQYSWPGNVRELEHFIERLCILADESEISEAKVAEMLGSENPAGDDFQMCAEEGSQEISLDAATAEFEKKLILKTLKQTKGNKLHAARLLKLTRQNLQYKLKKLGVR